MIIDWDTNSLLLTIDMYAKQIKDLEKASGYKVDELIKLFKENRISNCTTKKNISKH